MVGYAILLLFIAVALVGGLAFVLRAHAAKRERVDEELHDARTPTLEYAVPTGQDPAVILAALHREGYTATVDPNAAHQIVMVKCPEGLEAQRERVRSAIESANVTTADDGIPLRVDVRFRDET
jgi:hypothetical protein